MTTKRKTTSMAKYQRYTRVQLASLARKWQKKYATGMKSFTASERAAALRELKWIVKALRAKTIEQIDVKLNALKTQMAKRFDVAINSSKCTSAAIKRLIAKRRQVWTCEKIATLITVCSAFKVSSYKNPVGSAGYKSVTRTKTTRTKTGMRKVSKSVAVKYKKQTSTLKKEVQKLKQRNAFMRIQVAKFRKEVALMQRHYGTLNKAPKKGTVVNLKKVNQDVTNIVRFSNALSNAVSKQRKAG